LCHKISRQSNTPDFVSGKLLVLVFVMSLALALVLAMAAGGGVTPTGWHCGDSPWHSWGLGGARMPMPDGHCCSRGRAAPAACRGIVWVLVDWQWRGEKVVVLSTRQQGG